MENVGDTDMVVRALVGVVALYLGFKTSPWWFLLSLIAFITAYRRQCWLYNWFGWNTSKKVVEVKQVQIKKKKR